MSEVNHPDRYQNGKLLPNGDTEYETIVVIEKMGLGYPFCIATAVKYISRYMDKGEPIQDLEKSLWYLNRVERYPMLNACIDNIQVKLIPGYINEFCYEWNLPLELWYAIRYINDGNIICAITAIETHIKKIS